MNGCRQWLVLAAVATTVYLTPLQAPGLEDAASAVDEAIIQAGAPVFQALILHSRDEALASGVEPIPGDIRGKLAGFVAEGILNAARFRVEGGDELSLQFNAINYGDTLAITLDHVIIFKDNDKALHDISIWVRKLAHVEQYQRWGIRDFAVRYLRDADEVEDEAYEAEKKYTAWSAANSE